MIDVHEVLVLGGFVAYFVIGWILGRHFQHEAYEKRILDLMGEVDDLRRLANERPRDGTGRWLLIDYFFGEEGPVDVYQCSTCGWETIQETDYCPDCGFPIYGVEMTPEGLKRKEIALEEMYGDEGVGT